MKRKYDLDSIRLICEREKQESRTKEKKNKPASVAINCLVDPDFRDIIRYLSLVTGDRQRAIIIDGVQKVAEEYFATASMEE